MIYKCYILEQFIQHGQLNASHYKAVHTSDVLRLLLVYKFGGFYLDLDYVVIRDLSHYHNMIVEEGYVLFSMNILIQVTWTTLHLYV